MLLHSQYAGQEKKDRQRERAASPFRLPSGLQIERMHRANICNRSTPLPAGSFCDRFKNSGSRDMNRFEFHLRITAEQYLDYYRGAARHVVVRCTTGQNVQFPASFLQQFVTTDGISGHFVLICDKGRNSQLERLPG